MADTLIRLQTWYAARCNGLWEHAWGVKIDTLDNPGWSVTIDLNQTPHAERSFERVDIAHSDMDWIVCWKEGEAFNGRGDPEKLGHILEHFLGFVGA